MKTMKTQRAVLPLAFLSAALILGCQEQGSGPVEPEGLGPQFHAAHPACEGHKKNDPGCNGGGGEGDDNASAVTIQTVGGGQWTFEEAGSLVGSTNWTHFYSGDKQGTRSKPDFSTASFTTKVLMTPAVTVDKCDFTEAAGLENLLYGKLTIDPARTDMVFDIQVGFNADPPNPLWLTFFLFRWEDADGIFSASVNRRGSDQPGPTVEFLGPGNDFTDSTVDRTFRISGAKVVATKGPGAFSKRPTLACPNPHIIDVTIAGVPAGSQT